MLRIEAIEIDDLILDKIQSKHGVEFEEAEQASLSAKRHVRKGGRGIYKIFSQTDEGRYLLVVLAHSYEAVWRLVTARNMTTRERQLYQRERGE